MLASDLYVACYTLNIWLRLIVFWLDGFVVSAHRLPPFLFTKPSISRTEFTQITNRVVSEAFNFTRTSQYHPRYSNHRKLCSCQKLIKKTYVHCTYIMVHMSTAEHLWHRRLLNPWRTGAWTSALLFSAFRWPPFAAIRLFNHLREAKWKHCSALLNYQLEHWVVFVDLKVSSI